MMNGPAFERGFFLGRHGYKPSDQEKNVLPKIITLTFKSGTNNKNGLAFALTLLKQILLILQG